MSLEKLKRFFRREAKAVEADGREEPVATPPSGTDRETSTNAQAQGAADQPYSGNR